jgi:Tol biopolymer transport system component
MKQKALIWLPLAVLFLSACGGAKASPVASAEAANPSATRALTQALPPEATNTPAVTPSPEGTLPPSPPMEGLLYSSESGGGLSGLWLVEAGGQSKTLCDKADPVLSPDRTQVLYSDQGDIWLLDLATGKSVNLTPKTRDRIDGYYQWGPAGSDLIVFHWQPADDLGPVAGHLATMKTDGSNALMLDEDTRSISPAAPSPDGRTIAFDRAGEPWVYNLSGGKMPIFPNSFTTPFRLAVNPEWSPDGRKIAWQLFGDQDGTDGWSATAILDLDTMSVSLLHRYAILAGGEIGFHHLAWSPDGQWLAVADQAENESDGKVSLWVMRPDGSEEHHLGSGDRPVWSPDSKTVVYSASSKVFAAGAKTWQTYQVTLPEKSVVTDWVVV